MEFAHGRSNLQRDPFSLREATYIFWFLVYAVFQLDKASVWHQSLHPRNILLEPKRVPKEYELRIYNFVSRPNDEG